MAGKQTPRQKMINLMYLVFIAMMAMQVDRQVLRSFEGITVTLDDSSKLTAENNATFYEQIVNKAADDPDYAAIKGKADQVKSESNKVFDVIEGIKKTIMDEQEYQLPEWGAGDEVETNYNSLQNVDVITKLLFAKQDTPTAKGAELKKAIDDYKTFMATQYATSARDKERVEHIFSTEDRGRKSWLNDQFYDQPMVAGLANLTKIQSDIRTEEGNLVRTLLANKLQDEIELKAFQPIVMVPPFVRVGEKVEGKIAFGAFDNTLQGTVSVNGANVTLTDGVAQFNLDAGSPGKRTVSGTMTYKGPDGKDVSIPYSQEYEVVSETIVKPPSGAVITADKMNVVYRNLDNPITATVNGANGAISLSASSGSLSGSNGKYVFRPGSGNTVTFTASATTSTGKKVSGTQEFRIKPVPPARGVILGKTHITVPANGIAAQTVRVDWPDFLFDMTATVTSFKVKVPGQPTTSVNGTTIGSAASKAKKGDAVFIFNIKYKSSTGITGEASPITIEVR
ncbi:type IX secretion system motor protein PorM/GldM [Moheibacter lacus]|uniref:Gliding motility protein GldM n=1 Tax=Moheibacter lacus TaxID=2745851 RepID=A0A838ZQI0_9FLAO|nr:gliding motility protein GldM [Moheibacter lacus]MBA5629455.1 gliding motility protein GldM [Moheibacter lacus]